jgi:hypothetical protein
VLPSHHHPHQQSLASCSDPSTTTTDTDTDTDTTITLPQCPLPPRDQWDEALEARMVLLQARGLAPQFFLTAEALEPAGGGWALPQDVWDVLEVGGWVGGPAPPRRRGLLCPAPPSPGPPRELLLLLLLLLRCVLRPGCP